MSGLHNNFSTPARHVARHARGFTLIESLMAILIVSGVLVASLGTFGAIGKARQNQVDRTTGYALANRLLAEIMQCYFADPETPDALLGVDAGEGLRAAYDDVDDYDGYETTLPALRNGTPLAGYAGWKEKVEVIYVRSGDPGLSINGGDPQVLKRINVTVTSPIGTVVKLSGLRAKRGLNEQTPTSTINYLTFTGVSARVGDRGKTVYGGSRPLNVTTSQ